MTYRRAARCAALALLLWAAVAGAEPVRVLQEPDAPASIQGAVRLAAAELVAAGFEVQVLSASEAALSPLPRGAAVLRIASVERGVEIEVVAPDAAVRYRRVLVASERHPLVAEEVGVRAAEDVRAVLERPLFPSPRSRPPELEAAPDAVAERPLPAQNSSSGSGPAQLGVQLAAGVAVATLAELSESLVSGRLFAGVEAWRWSLGVTVDVSALDSRFDASGGEVHLGRNLLLLRGGHRWGVGAFAPYAMIGAGVASYRSRAEAVQGYRARQGAHTSPFAQGALGLQYALGADWSLMTELDLNVAVDAWRVRVDGATLAVVEQPSVGISLLLAYLMH